MNYAPEIAGVGRYTGEIAEYLASRGHDVCVITTPPHYPGWTAREGYGTRGWHRERRKGVEIRRCPLYLHPEMGGWRRFLAPASFALSSAWIALREIVARKPDVVLVVEPTLLVAPMALLGAWLVGARTALHVQDLEVDAAFAVGHLPAGGVLRQFAAAFEKATLSCFHRVVTISDRMADRLAAKGVPSGRLAIVRNWVDLDLIRPMPRSQAYRRKLGVPEDVFVALYSGAIGRKQGMSLLIETAGLAELRGEVVFVIAGDGPMKAEVEAAAKESANVISADFQPEEAFAEFLSIADVLVLPQDRQAADLVLPSKLGGMLASGRPVLVTADQGTEISEFLGNSVSICPPADARALGRAFLSIKAAPPLGNAEAERLRLARRLSKPEGLKAFEDAILFVDPLGESC